MTSPFANDVIEVQDSARLQAHPLVSVLMTTYNHEPYIAEAIEGVILQVTDFPIELVIGEDCSSDGTRAIVLQYQRDYPQLVRVVISGRNVGVAENIRRIYERSKGKYLAFCEGDDFWCQERKLQDQVEILENQPRVTAVFSDFAVAALKRGRWKVDMENTAFRALGDSDLRGDVFSQCLDGRLRTLTAVYRREVMAAIYDKRLPRNEYPFGDNFLRAQAAVMGDFDRVPGVRAVYRCSPNSATRSGGHSSVKFLQASRRFNERFPDYFAERTGGPSFDFAEHDVLICRAAAAAGDPGAFQEAYARLRAVRTPPVSLRAANLLMRWPTVLGVVLALRSRLRSLLNP